MDIVVGLLLSALLQRLWVLWVVVLAMVLALLELRTVLLAFLLVRTILTTCRRGRRWYCWFHNRSELGCSAGWVGRRACW